MPTSFRSLLILTLGTLIAAPAFAVINGEAADEARFAAVGALRIGSDKGVGCTATVIAAKWIVTADHCVHAIDGGEEEGGELVKPSGYEFRLGNDFKKPVFKSKLKRWISAPKLHADDEVSIDLAFGELATVVPLAKLKLEAIAARPQEWDAADLAAAYLHVGYGTRQAFGDGPSPLKEKRQLARFTATSATGNALLHLFGDAARLEAYIRAYHPDIDLEFGDNMDAIVDSGAAVEDHSVHVWDARGRRDLTQVKEPATGWQDTCFGDSGGPLLREINGKFEIVGVVSQGMNRTCAALGTKFTTFGPKVREVMRSLGL